MRSIDLKKITLLLPVMYCFGIMGFIDVVAVATSYVQQDFDLSDKLANLIPSMALMWFVIISIPTTRIMSRIGRKNTVLLSLVITLVAMIIPFVTSSFVAILVTFAIMGIGNTILQVSLNPLFKNIVTDDKTSSFLSLGQFFKAIISLLGPVIMGLCARYFGDWQFVFAIYGAATLLSILWLAFTPIQREVAEVEGSSWGLIFSLLKDRFILVCFLVIVLIVGFEVSFMTAVPKLLSEVHGLSLEESGLGCSLFYACKTIASFIGAIILVRVAPLRFLKFSLILTFGGMILFAFSSSLWTSLAALVVVGLFAANVFAIIFSVAMNHKSEYANEISALMVTGIAGGALLPPIMGVVADVFDQRISLIVPIVALFIILVIIFRRLK